MGKRNLGILYSHFLSRTENLIDSFNSSFPAKPIHNISCRHLQQDGRERVIIKLQYYWGQFCQELLLKSAVGSYQTLTSGVLTPANISNVPDIYVEANKISRGRNFPWHIPTYCTNLAKKIGTYNYNQIKSGLSITAPINDLRSVRNYIVHPSKETQVAYKRVAIKYGQPNATPITLLSTAQSSGGTLFGDWVSSIRLMAEIAVR